MGTDEKNKQTASSSNPGQGGEQRADQEKKDTDKKKMKGKKGGKAAGQQEELHKCCGCRFPLLVALLQLILGVSITVLAFIMAGTCPSLLVRDTPHWAGIIVSVVALLGLVLLCLPYQPDEKTLCHFALKLAYFLLSAFGLVICVLAVAFAAYHYSLITHFTCHNALDACQCTLDTTDPLGRSFLYQDVADCGTITSTLKLFLLLQMTLNLLLALVCLAACFVMWKDRYQVFYVGLWFHGSATTQAQQQKV
ncbi:sarcospan [Rhinophrynus dorsalis]